MGLVAQVFNEPTLESLRGHIAIGHTRYSTTGNSNWENAQPTFRTTASGHIALAHNGNLVNTGDLIKMIQNDAASRGELLTSDDAITRIGVSDTEVITSLLAASPDLPIESTALQVLPKLEGAFSLVFMDEQTLFAARDRHGIRPLVLGRLERGWVLASETAALDIIGASYVREVEPGELIAIDEHGLRSSRFAEASQRTCVFEYVYLARPDTVISGKNVNAARVEVGKVLAQEAPAEADLVIPVPESGTPAAIGYATESGIPFAQGLVKNPYVGRTFIEPSQSIRQIGIRLKLNPLKEIIAGKRLVVVDDSIVRGNTQRAIVRMLREAGATEVHVRIASPPVQWPCFLGVDFATKSQLIAAGLDISEIKQTIGADSLAYVSMQGLVGSTGLPKSKLCRACFDGEYPVDPPEALMQESPLLELEVLASVHNE
jgi:amidophosphoribosyltransferase